jgi:hypothetical protein
MLQQIKADLAARPLIPAVAGGAAAAVDDRVLIIGGQIASGIDVINFSATCSPSKIYDPDVDESYPSGLGNASLYRDGVYVGKVLVRHGNPSWPAPFIAGQLLRVVGESIVGSGGSYEQTALVVSW